jgi:hypothetical protein
MSGECLQRRLKTVGEANTNLGLDDTRPGAVRKETEEALVISARHVRRLCVGLTNTIRHALLGDKDNQSIHQDLSELRGGGLPFFAGSTGSVTFALLARLSVCFPSPEARAKPINSRLESNSFGFLTVIVIPPRPQQNLQLSVDIIAIESSGRCG